MAAQRGKSAIPALILTKKRKRKEKRKLTDLSHVPIFINRKRGTIAADYPPKGGRSR